MLCSEDIRVHGRRPSEIVMVNQSPSFVSDTSSSKHHIITGSFRALSLALLAFSPFNNSLELVENISELGPHQYLTTNARRNVVYATSWAQPPTLSSWAVESHPSWSLSFINSVLIAATSSYISLPPPYTHIYSTGGPTGEVHQVDTTTGGFGKKVQQFLFVSPDELANADKTRVALRYGSHAVEVSPRGHAFIPHLGTNTICMYSVDRISGLLTLLSKTDSPRAGDDDDGPRHVVISPDGKLLYSITEHTNYVDVYSIKDTSLEHLACRSLLPAGLRRNAHRFRGDTLRLSPSTPTAPSSTHLFATTRGSGETRGWLAVFALDNTGLFVSGGNDNNDKEEVGVMRWETPTSGGRANAIELRTKDEVDDGLWIVLTDDDDDHGGPAVRVLDWDPVSGIRVVAEWPKDGTAEGASHAIWLD